MTAGNGAVRRVCMFARVPRIGLGDLAQRNIVLNQLRAAFPAAELTWVMGEYTTRVPFLDEFVRRHSYATEVLVCPDAEDGDPQRWRRFVDGLPARRFEVCVVDPRSFRLGVRDAWQAGIEARVAIPTGGPDDRLITHPMRPARRPGVPGPDLYDYTEALVTAVGAELTAEPAHVVPPLPMRPEELPAWTGRRPLVGLHPGGSTGWNRRWPAARFVELGARLAGELGATLAVLGSNDELADTTRLRAEIVERSHGADVRLCLGEPLNRVANLIGRMDLLVANDSGLAHLAPALRTPTVVLYGPVGDEFMWQRVYPLHLGADRFYACQNRTNEDNEWPGQCAIGCPCDYVSYDGPYPRCLADITVDEVWPLVRRQLGDRPVSTSGLERRQPLGSATNLEPPAAGETR
jgi:ADP-heptose:LPS heptosyltransferase